MMRNRARSGMVDGRQAQGDRGEHEKDSLVARKVAADRGGAGPVDRRQRPVGGQMLLAKRADHDKSMRIAMQDLKLERE
ncbi:MAG TPA: hypothetical protein P5022_13005 [Candidatus Paceibacterota bacterium]|nr:hypothetical protein [Candidatus Paceibacterota bacterium]